MIRINLAFLVYLLFPAPSYAQDDTPYSPKDLWNAVREENVERVKIVLASGVDVNSRNDYGATALMFAADRGNLEIGKLLLDAGADPLIKDSFYNSTPVAWAFSKGFKELVLEMLAKSSESADIYLFNAIQQGDAKWAASLLEKCQTTEAGLINARDAAVRKSKNDKFKDLPALFSRFELPKYQPPEPLTAEQLERYVGQYQTDSFNVEVKGEDGELKISFAAQTPVPLEYLGENRFSMNGADVKFVVEQDKVVSLSMAFGGNVVQLKPAAAVSKSPDKATGDTPAEDTGKAMIKENKSSETERPAFGPSSEASIAADRAISSPNWPSFRGTGARGIADGQTPPIEWTVGDKPEENKNVKWSVAVPGLGLSSPVVWKDRIYLTSAVSEQADNQLKIGLYGDVASINENVEYAFVVYCFSKSTGDLLWSKTCKTAVPAVKRHAKSSHANPSVAVNERCVVAFFGSEGLYCFDHQGNEIWSKDLGFLDSGWFYDASYQWGFGSSPVIFQESVIVQCDVQESSFIASFDLSSGHEQWRTERDEIPGWSTPTVHQFGDVPMLITHATKAARGYDVRNGALLWSVGKHSEIVVPTPFVAHDLIFIASGYSPIQPILAIRPTARGEFGLKAEENSEQVAWSTQRNGPYMPTPIVYGDYLYVCSNAGVLTCYYAKTGAEVYKKRMTARGGALAFTASPVAADGHLYFAAEDGRVIVVKAGPEYELVATNASGGSILATPAISEGLFLVRTADRLNAFQATGGKQASDELGESSHSESGQEH